METELKERIIKAIRQDRELYTSDTKHAKSLDINPSVYNRIKNGATEQVLTDGKWINLARVLGVNLKDDTNWVTAETPVFTYVTEQLAICHRDSISNMLCDLPDIGKSHAAEWYAANHANAVYVDCSQVKTKHRLVRMIAQKLGCDYKGKYADVYDDLVYYVRSMEAPLLIIVDEAGDLHYEAFLELKALWNATQHCCGWYMIGAVGLKKKMERGIAAEKVGFAEMFSRYGSNYGKCTPNDAESRKQFIDINVSMIIKANAPKGANVSKMTMEARGSGRRTRTIVKKHSDHVG